MGHANDLLRGVETLTMDNEALDALSKVWETMYTTRCGDVERLTAEVDFKGLCEREKCLFDAWN
jgi:hypothetical protein